jgi:hypothetical protein
MTQFFYTILTQNYHIYFILITKLPLYKFCVKIVSHNIISHSIISIIVVHLNIIVVLFHACLCSILFANILDVATCRQGSFLACVECLTVLDTGAELLEGRGGPRPVPKFSILIGIYTYLYKHLSYIYQLIQLMTTNASWPDGLVERPTLKGQGFNSHLCHF